MHPIKVKFGEKIKRLIIDGTKKAMYDFARYKTVNNTDKKMLDRIIDFYYYNFYNENHQMIFDDFDDLSVFIECFEIPINFSSKLIFAFIEDNIKNNILTDAKKLLIIDKYALLNNDFTSISKNDLIKLLNSGELNRIIVTDDINKLTEEEQLIHQEIVEFMAKNNNSSDLEKLRSNTKLIKDHYFDKIDTYTLDDLPIIKEALINLEVADDLSENIILYLQKQITKRKAPVSYEKSFNITIQDNVPKISCKEYNLLNQSLKTYFDLESMTLVRPLSIKEVYYCLYLLKKMNQKEDVIQKFMKLARQENNKQNVIAQYYFVIDKIEHYGASLNLLDKVNDLKECFHEYCTSSEEDKNTWYLLLLSSLKDLKTYLPNDGEYEKEMAKSLYNKKKV